MNFSQLLAILVARKWIALWVFALTVLIATLVSLLLPKTYYASATVVINTKGTDPVTGVSLPATLMPGYIATQLDIIKSRNVALKVVNQLKIAENPLAKERFINATGGEGDINQWYAEQFLQSLDVKPSRESSVIEIGYSGTDPEFSAVMANAFATAYIDTNLELKTSPAKQAVVFFDSQIKHLREDVEKARAKLSAYQKDHGITTSEGRLDVEMARLEELSSQLVTAQAQTYDSASRQAQLKIGQSAESPEILGNSLIQSLKSQLVQAEAKLGELSQRLGANHPQYQAAVDDIKNLKSSIQIETAKATGAVSQTAKVSQMREHEIFEALENQKQRVLKLKSEQDEMAVLVREVENAQRIYDNALMRFGQTTMESQFGHTDVSILNPANPPVKHASPKIGINILLSIFLGGLLGVGFALASEMMDRRVRSAEDLTGLIPHPVLADLSKPKTKKYAFVVLKNWFSFRQRAKNKHLKFG